MKYKAWILGIAGLILVPALFLFGYLYWNGAFFSTPGDFEHLLPPEVSFVASLQPTDEDERGRFNKLFNIVMQDKANAVLPLVAGEFSKNINVNMSLEDQIALFGAKPNFAVAYAKPNLYALFSVENPPVAHGILKKYSKEILIDDEKSFLSKFSGAKDTIYTGIAGNIVFAASANEESARRIIARKTSPFRIFYKSFASTKFFRQAFKGANKPFSGYIALSQNQGKGSVVFAKAEETGLNLDNLTIGGGIGSAKTYLYKKLPAGQFLLFSESHSLGKIILEQITPELKSNFTSDVKKYTGLDFEKDLMPFLDRGFAFEVHDSGSLIPAISLFIDANSAPEKAQAVVKMLDETIPRLAATINAAVVSSEGKSIIETGKFKWGTLGAVIKVYLDRVPQDKFNIPALKYFSQPVEISYGIAPENLFFISLLPDFEKTFASADKIESSPLFKSAEKLNAAADGITLLDGNNVLVFVERFFAIAQKDKKLSEKEKNGFETAKIYIKPFKSFVQVSQSDGNKIFGKAFLRIEK